MTDRCRSSTLRKEGGRNGHEERVDSNRGASDMLDKMLLAIAVEELTEDPTSGDSLLSTLQDTLPATTACLAACLPDERTPSSRVENYVEDIVPSYSEVDFRSHFRMGRSTFEDLHHELGRYVTERHMTVSKKLLATIWLLSNQESFRGVADRFGISKGNLHFVVIDVCGVISSKQGDHIRWPKRQELPKVVDDFKMRCGFPGAVGAIDGTHIAIPGPGDHRDSFINRKGFPSIQLQVVCQANLTFSDVYVGWPGAVHDARVFRNSPLFEMLERDCLPIDTHLLGDSAYPLKTYLMVPFKDNGHLTSTQKKYNKMHSSTRVDVERAIGLLKCKFRRLKFLDMRSLAEIPSIIVTACVLHNFILERETLLDEDLQNAELYADHDRLDQPQTEGTDAAVSNAQQKRADIAETLT